MLEVDQGDLALVVTENGSLESAKNATVRCQVEALIGMVGGAQGAGGPNARGGAQGNRAGQGGQGGQAGQGGQTVQQPEPAQAQPKAKAKAGASTAKGAAAAATTGAAATKQSDGPVQEAPVDPSGGGGKGGGGAAGTQITVVTIVKPTIRSFTYEVVPHQPLKPATKVATQQTKNQQVVDPSMAGRGGGGGGGRGGSGGGGQNSMEKAGSTRIISILPEGSWVKGNDIVCELDSSAFRDELQAQRIRYAQAKAWVEQARSLVEVSEISLREYRDGIYPQDVQLIRQYLSTCRTEMERTERAYLWSKETTAKGFRSTAQLKADELAMQKAKISLDEAEGMEERLEKYTAPRLIKNLEAKIQAIRADKLALEQSFEVESDRLRKLETMVANCTMRAPDDGIVVYVNQSNRMGQTENPIQEGVTVRQGQPIFYLPDPNHMQVKAKVNESKVSMIQGGQRALIVVDAFPDRPLWGTVTEITAIPAAANGPTSDVRVYYAVVKIDSGGFSELRPGLSAEVNFLIEEKRKVTRVPIRAVHWHHDKAYVAVASDPDPKARSEKKGPTIRWQPVTLGISDASHFEVLSGLTAGEKVVANPQTLPPPKVVEPRQNVAVTDPRPQG
jgi:multidrug resistance efflux pump